MASVQRAVLTTIVCLGLGGVATAAPSAPSAPSIDGGWDGAIEIASISLKIHVEFSGGADALAATIDIPQQGARAIALTNVRREAAKVHFELPAGPGLAVFDGELVDGRIAGRMTQAGMEGRFHLERPGAAATATPAEVAPPYREDEVEVAGAGVELACTLTRPDEGGPFAAVVFLTGSGPQNRDEEILGFAPFAVLADDLTRAGLASLRCDDRGVGGSTGSVFTSTTADFAADAEAAMSWLGERPDVDAARVGLLGHSEGAIAAAIVASRAEPAFIVLLAGPALTGQQIVRAQAEWAARSAGLDEAQTAVELARQELLFAAVRTGDGWEEVEARAIERARGAIEGLPAEQRAAIGDPDAHVTRIVQSQLAVAKTPWYAFYLDYDPVEALHNVTCPILALFAELDTQVDPLPNTVALGEAMRKAGNDDVTVRTVAGANHLFQSAKTGSPTEYATLAKSFAPGFVDGLRAWLLARTRAAGKTE